MKKTVKLLSLLMGMCMLFSSCAQSMGDVANKVVNNGVSDSVIDNGVNDSVVDNIVPTDTESTDEVNTEQIAVSSTNETIPEKGTYNEGVALV